jgi:hypothetical protein
MKKLFHLIVIVLMLSIFAAPIAEARKGKTEDTSTSKSSSKQSSTSQPEKSSKRKSNDSFTNTAKTNQAKSAWQSYSKKQQESKSPPASTLSPSSAASQNQDSSALERELEALRNKAKSGKKRKQDKDLAEQMAAIEQQIAETKRQQQLIAVAQTFAQTVLNKQRQPVTKAPVAVKNPLPAAEKSPSGKKGTPWGGILLILGAVVGFFIWRSKNNSATLYRI